MAPRNVAESNIIEVVADLNAAVVAPDKVLLVERNGMASTVVL